MCYERNALYSASTVLYYVLYFELSLYVVTVAYASALSISNYDHVLSSCFPSTPRRSDRLEIVNHHRESVWDVKKV